MSEARPNGIEPGVCIYCEDLLPAGPPRVLVTRGVEDASGVVVDGVPYRSPSIVPTSAWRPARLDELEGLLAPTPDGLHPGTTVSVLRMPDAVVRPFVERGFHEARTVKDADRLLFGRGYAEAVAESVDQLWPFLESPEGLTLLGTCVESSGLRTTSTHVAADGTLSWSGLHIDNWSGPPTVRREYLVRQMCINLGTSDRFLIFVNRPAGDLIARVEGAMSWIEYVALGMEFIRRYPDYPIIKVRVRPGEAYIAPTENMIHDGTTEGADTPDITLNLRGRFKIAPDAADLAELERETMPAPGEAVVGHTSITDGRENVARR